jgi:Cu-Zn family superoxide dismutase
MKNYLVIALLCATTFLTACSTEKDTEVATATLATTADAKEMGAVKFYQLADGKMRMDLEINYPAKADSTVAVHFHEHGDCGNMGENAHGHWNPTNENHGKWDSGAFHSGDIGNIQLDAKGHGKVSVTTDRWNIVDNDVKTIIGRGIIVHGGTDDYTTQPTGNSGPRIGCGVITKI